MRALRSPRLTPFLLLFAWFQAFAPAVAVIADSWRVDGRTPYAHMESETGSGCAVVHGHECALCSIASTGAVPPRAHEGSCVAPERARRAFAYTSATVGSIDGRPASQRAPPALQA